MNRTIVFLLLLFLSFGCTIQKRQFRSGWHISFDKQFKDSDIQNDESKQSFSCDTISTEIQGRDLSQNEVSYVAKHRTDDHEVNKTNAEAVKKDSLQKDRFAPKKIIEQSSKIESSSVSNSQNRVSTDSFGYEKGLNPEDPLFPRVLGGFFGVLLALIALIPLFFIVFFILDESVNSLTFKEKESDGYFVKAFKKSYHAVFRVGLLIFITLLVLAASTLIILAGLNLLGALGLVLAILLVIIILLIYLLIWRWLLDFLMFKE